MHVLHLLPSLNPTAGGVSQAVRTIIAGLQPYGVVNEVACTDDPAAAFLAGIPFRVHALGPGKTAWGYSKSLRPWLKQHLAEYDAILAHGLWQYQTYAVYKAWTALKGKKPRLFVMPHGMLDPYFQRARGRRLKAIRNQLFWKGIENKLINTADGLLFTCETEKLLAREPFKPYRPHQELVVGLGIEPPPPFVPAMQQAFEEKTGTPLSSCWLYISRLHEKKGVDLLLKAYRQLKSEGHSLPPLVIAGPGLDTAYGKEMQALAAPDTGIFFPGMLTGNAKWGAFYGCEVFILPSHQENFGIAVVEALACSKPVLISDQVNIWREIVADKAGFAAPDTLDGTVQLLSTWLHLTEMQKQEAVRAAQPAFSRHFSLQSVSQKLLAALS